MAFFLFFLNDINLPNILLVRHKLTFIYMDFVCFYIVKNKTLTILCPLCRTFIVHLVCISRWNRLLIWTSVVLWTLLFCYNLVTREKFEKRQLGLNRTLKMTFKELPPMKLSWSDPRCMLVAPLKSKTKANLKNVNKIIVEWKKTF